MRVLLLGATGFIGQAVLQALLADGHTITALGRSIDKPARQFPSAHWHKGDLSRMTTPSDWSSLLQAIDCVINCAGALQDGLRDNLAAVQQDAMLALYQAAKANGNIRIIQISAAAELGRNPSRFIATKLAADAALAQSGLDHLIIRPALVIGRNAHGGSALLRALAAIPFVSPLVYADSPVELCHLDELAATIAKAVRVEPMPASDITLADPDAVTLSDLVAQHRRWLGLPNAPTLSIPPAIAAPVIALADLAGRLGWRSPMRSTAMTIMGNGITSGTQSRPVKTSRSVADLMAAQEAGVQDLWFARLYLLKPVIIAILSLFWLLSGLIPLLDVSAVAARFGSSFPPALANALTLFTSALDVSLGLAVLWRPFTKAALLGMIATSLAYLASGSLIDPGLWIDPLGPLVKVLPAIALTLIGLAILEER